MKRSNFVWCDDCGEDVAIPHNSKDCADKWKRECIIARNEIARLRKAIETHRDAEGGGIHTYSWYDKELYKALGEQE